MKLKTRKRIFYVLVLLFIVIGVGGRIVRRRLADQLFHACGRESRRYLRPVIPHYRKDHTEREARPEPISIPEPRNVHFRTVSEDLHPYAQCGGLRCLDGNAAGRAIARHGNEVRRARADKATKWRPTTAAVAGYSKRTAASSSRTRAQRSLARQDDRIRRGHEPQHRPQAPSSHGCGARRRRHLFAICSRMPRVRTFPPSSGNRASSPRRRRTSLWTRTMIRA